MLAELLALARTLACDGNAEIPRIELARVIEKAATPEQLATAIHVLQEEALQRLDQAPMEACGLGRIAHELANVRETPALRAETALTLATALNRIGEFSAALTLAQQAASFFAAQCEQEKEARALCEAAWANTFIGDLSQANAKIERARGISSSSLVQTRCDWIQARVLRAQTQYSEAIALFRKACEVYKQAQLPLEVARCECELANTFIWTEDGDTLALLDHARQIFQESGSILDATLCDLLRINALVETSQYSQALEPLVFTRQQFAVLGAGYYVAWCILMEGVVYRHLNRFDESLHSFHQARDYFLAHGIRAQVSACDINLGNTYYVLNRYDEALASYQEAADLSLTDSREARTVRLYTNMGLVYSRQGNFSKALDLHHRALQIATSKELTDLAVGTHTGLARCYRQLGQYAEALTHLQERERLARHVSGERYASHKIDLADLHIARGEIHQAGTYLEQARKVAAADGLDSLVAVCDLLLAQISVQTVDGERVLARIRNARTLFLKHAQIVDAALCDLTEGELHLQRNETAVAQDCFQRARTVLSPAFPDQAWRTDYGLGRGAAAVGDKPVALDHYLRAVRTIALSRSLLVTEQLSNDFFARRQSVFDDALTVAFQLRAADSTLEIIEASKARTFLTLLQNSDWKLRDDHGDPRIAWLITRERDLRYQLAALQRRFAVQAAQENGEPLRGGEMFAVSDAALQELSALTKMYEAVVIQLRLAIAGLAGVSAPAPFALERFRDVANVAFGADWTALDYYLSGDTLTIVVVSPNRLSAERKTFSAYDRAILDDCTTTEPDVRELIYRGTLRGVTAPTPSLPYLKHLYKLLIPEELGTTLIVSPNRWLHTLPFHALVAPCDNTFLVERHPIIYSPNLQALQLLLNEPVDGAIKRPLVVGVSDFGNQMRPLSSAATEVDAVRQAFGGCGESLWGEQATRRELLGLNAMGELKKFDVLHFATHAILDGAAPHRSRLLLSDDALTTTDISGLSLQARLVTLSACQTALGESGRGDELVGLARAFFYAGARALLATLWHVEDRANTELMTRFYSNLTRGENAAKALQIAQVDMICAGCSPYQWASFVLMGQP